MSDAALICGESTDSPFLLPAGEDVFWQRVKKTDTCWLWVGATWGKGYGHCPLGVGKGDYAHRVSYRMAFGTIPNGMQVDHICHTKKCVRPEHLRLATQKQNMENQSGAKANSASGVRGVTWIRARGKYRAQVGHNGQVHYLGLYATITDAEAVAIAKRNELFTHNDRDRHVPC